MKLSAALILILLAGLFFSFPDNYGNLLVNGDFEISSNGKMPDDWSGDPGIYSLSGESASGSHSLKYSNSDPSVYKLCSQQIDAKPGRNYSAGIKVKTSDVAGGDFGASFCVEWFDAGGKWIGGAYPKGVKGTNGWTDINAVVSVPDNAAKVVFYCYVRKGMTGTAWFDDAYIRPYTSRPVNVVMLQPVYRGLLFSGSEKIVLSVSLDNAVSGGILSAAILDSSGRELVDDKEMIKAGSSNYRLSLDASGIKNGTYAASVMLKSQSGDLLDSWNKTIRKISSADIPEVYFDNQKRLVVHNKKVFPLGMYWGSVNEADLKIYSDSKFNFILPYSSPTPDQMNLAEKYNVKVIYSVKDFYAGSQFVPSQIKSPKDELVLLDQTINRFKDNPPLLAWYNNDEILPEHLERLEEHYNVLASEDPNHPVLSIIDKPLQAGLYLKSTDIIGGDPYVVPNQEMDMVGKTTKTIFEKTAYSQPVWMVIQAHNIGNYREFIPNPQDYRSPDYNEMRCMSWQAVCEGADGLIYYSFFDLKRNADVPFEIQWSNLKKIVSEIDSFSDVLLSEEKADSVMASGITGSVSWLDWTTREFNNKLYIFAVNNGKNAGEVKFVLPSKYKSVKESTGTASRLSLENSVFKDSFGKMEVKIYIAE